MSALVYKRYMSPIGALSLVANDSYLVSILFEGEQFDDELGEDFSENSHEILDDTSTQLDEYFLGTRKTFDLPLLVDGTAFQKVVWNELLNIPYGETISYSEQAARMGNPKAVRAVGATNGKNHLPIVIPCHRVIGKNGTLTGYAGGVDIKKFLLNLELTA